MSGVRFTTKVQMKIFSAKQVYEADKRTIEKQGISSDALMERASVELFRWLDATLQNFGGTIHLFCGIGNNGGDGLALARHLQEQGYTIKVYVVNYSDKRADDFLTNLDRLKEHKVWPDFIVEGSVLPATGPGDLIVDAVFGIGLNRPPDAWVGRLFEWMNASEANRLSIDVPSGLYVDQDTRHTQVVKADMLLSFQVPKLIFFLPRSGAYIRQWDLLDIGLDSDFIRETETDYTLVDASFVRPWYRVREKFSHKGTFGHALIIGGSYGKMGAVQLSASGCLRSGSGLVSVYVPRCGYLPLQTALPEVMVRTDPAEEYISTLEIDPAADAVGMGIGLGTEESTMEALSAFLDSYRGPLVLDADALNILSARKELLKKLPPQTVLTPHPGELRRLIGDWEGDFEKLEKAHEFSGKYDCVLLIKGAHSITLYNGKGYVNSSGNPGMATAGSGDTLTGIITGLLAQGYPPLHASILGAYLHGRAGDLAAELLGYEALTATSIIGALGGAFLELTRARDDSENAANQPS